MNSVDAHIAPPGAGIAQPPDEFASGNALSPGMRLREFEITGTLGEGGFSIVYAANDLQLGRGVAIKEYIPTSLAGRSASSTVRLRSEHHRDTFDAGLHGFINESRLLAQFKHPALVEVLQFWEENDTAYMVMPRYSGKTLRWVLRNMGTRCDERWLRGIIAPVLDVLEMLHARNVFHRDIAPDNILIKDDGTPVLLDLGSAREIVTGLQKAITVVVKPGYAPIEQYSSDFSLPQGPWTDIYAVGALLYFAVTGSAPAASISRIMKDGLKPLAEQPSSAYSREFLAAIDHALALQPSARPQSIAELRKELRITDADHTVIALDSEQFAHADAADTPPDEDDALTVIVSAEEIADLARQLLSHITGAAAMPAAVPAAAVTPEAAPISAAPPASSDNLLEAPLETAAPATSSFPEMEELLAGRNGTDARPVSVPTMHIPENGEAMPVPDTRGRRWHLPLAALATIAVVIGVGFVMINNSGNDAARDAMNSVAASGLTAPAVEAEPVVASPAPADAAAANSPPTDTESSALDWAAALAISDLGIPTSVSTDAQTAAQANAESGSQEWPMFSGQDVSSLPPVDLTADGNTAAMTAIPTPDSRSAETTESAALAASAPAPAQTDKPSRPKPSPKAPTVALASNVHLNVQPWAEVWVDGKQHGISPPLRGLALPEGAHAVELRSPGLAAHKRQITIKSGESVTIEHRFAVAAGSNP